MAKTDGFTWHELMSRDPAGSQRFYETVTGVEVQVLDGPSDYRLLLVGGRPVAGITGPRPGADTWPSGGPDGHWVSYLGTDDVERSVRAATAAGGTALLPPTDVPGWGRAAVLRDPDGATFGLYQVADGTA